MVVTDTSIEILDNIYFEAGKDVVRPASFPIVDAVAATLAGNPTITKLEVQGHAAATEGDAWGLSTRRAAAVRAYLMDHGVAGSGFWLTLRQGYGRDAADGSGPHRAGVREEPALSASSSRRGRTATTTRRRRRPRRGRRW